MVDPSVCFCYDEPLSICNTILEYSAILLSLLMIFLCFLLCLFIFLNRLIKTANDKIIFFLLLILISVKSVFYATLCYLRKDFMQDPFKNNIYCHIFYNGNCKSFITPIHLFIFESTILLLFFLLFTLLCKNNNLIKNSMIIFPYLGLIINGHIFLYEKRIKTELSVVVWFNVIHNLVFMMIFCPYKEIRKIIKRHLNL